MRTDQCIRIGNKETFMDITNELRQEYDTLRTLLQRAAGSSADKELALYLIRDRKSVV